MTDNTSFLHQRGRYADIIQQALASYDEWMLDDDFDAQSKLHEIMKRMRERFNMSAATSPDFDGPLSKG